MLVLAQCKTANHGPCLFWWGLGLGHSLVKVAKLQCKTAGLGPCLFQWGAITVWLRLQSYNVKLLTIVLVYSGRGLGITVIFGPKLFFQPKQLSQH